MWPLWKTACPTFNNENHGNQHFPFCPAHQKHKDAADTPSPHGDLLSQLASPALCAPWPAFLFILLLPFLTEALDQASGRQEAAEEVRWPGRRRAPLRKVRGRDRPVGSQTWAWPHFQAHLKGSACARPTPAPEQT